MQTRFFEEGKGPGRGDSYVKQTEMLVILVRGTNFGCFVSLMVFQGKTPRF